MKIVGLTGGIGSGKSTVAKIFESLGVPVYNSDKEAKHLMTSSQSLKNELVRLFGKKAFEHKKLNKNYISSKVFKNPDLLQKLNEIVHPAVKNHFLEWTTKQNSEYVIQETALIFENSSQDYYDVVILVTAPKKERIRRVMERDGVQEIKVLERMSHQLDDSDKIELSDFVVENLDLEYTHQQVYKIHNQLRSKST